MIGSADGVLIVGYGNSLRTDDGLGWHVAARLADDSRLAEATILQLHQLTPELALDVSRARFVVFVDARQGGRGTLAVEPLPAADDVALSWTHHVEPGVLLALARDLYGHAPEAAAVSVGVASIEAGDRMSPQVEAMIPEVVERVVRLIDERGAVADRTAEPELLEVVTTG